MCAAKDHIPELSNLHLGQAMDFFYTSQGEDPDIDGVDDLKEFKSTQDAFKLLGFSSKEQQNIYKILAGILHLGNVPFEAGSGKMDSESCSIPAGDQSLAYFAGNQRFSLKTFLPHCRKLKGFLMFRFYVKLFLTKLCFRKR